MPYYGKQDPYNQTEAARRMIAACNRQRWHVASSLLELYEEDIVHVRGIGNYDCTPLHAAAAAGQTDFLVALLDRDADVDAPATHGYTPLYMAVRNNRPNAVRMLLRAGADPDIRCGGSTPLLTAVEKGYESIVACLLDAGASTYVENSGGDQPLHIAARLGYFDVVQALVEAGADIGMRGARGLSAMQVANEAGQYDVCDFLRSGHAFARSDSYGRLVPYESGRYESGRYESGRFSDRYFDGYGDYDMYSSGYPRHGYGRHHRMNRLWDRGGHNDYLYGLGLRYPYEDRYERHYGFGSRYRSGSLSPTRSGWSDDYHGFGSRDDDYVFRRGFSAYDRYGSSSRMNRRERYRMKNYGSYDVAGMIGDFVGRGMTYSEKSRFMRRIERNAERYRVSGSTLMSDRYGSESLARMLVTDSSGYCKTEDLWATMEFIRAFREGGSYAY